MDEQENTDLRNKNILRGIIPYLAIFVMTMSFAGFRLVQNIAGGASASDNYKIEIRPVTTPLETTNEWEWSVIVFNNKPDSSSNLTYNIQWCNETQGEYGSIIDESCKDIEDTEFNIEVTNGTLPVNSPETIHSIKHQSIDCGRVELEIEENGTILKQFSQDTGKRCNDNELGIGGLSTFSASADNSDILSELYCNFYKCDGKEKDSNTPPYSGDNPGTPVPSQGPGTPGAPEPPQPVPQPAPEPPHVSALAQYILNNCSGGTVNGNNSLCMRNLNIGSKNDALARDKIVRSANTQHRYGGLQCIGFVKGAVAAETGINYSNSGNARSYASNNKPPYRYFSASSGAQPQVNDLAVWTSTGVNCADPGEPFDDCGHIAYVTKVQGSDKFFVTEANNGCRGCVRVHQRLYTTSDNGFGGFLRI